MLARRSQGAQHEILRTGNFSSASLRGLRLGKSASLLAYALAYLRCNASTNALCNSAAAKRMQKRKRILYQKYQSSNFACLVLHW